MSSTATFIEHSPTGVEPPRHPKQPDYLHDGYGLMSWLTTHDHKRIGILYMISITFFFLIGGIAATLMRIELITPTADLVTSDTYNKLFTLHGVTMVWFFLIPAVPAVLGNFVLPLMIGAKDVAFPRLNLLSWWLFITGGTFTLYALISGGWIPVGPSIRRTARSIRTAMSLRWRQGSSSPASLRFSPA